MGMKPNFTEVGCNLRIPPVYKWNVTVGSQIFTSEGKILDYYPVAFALINSQLIGANRRQTAKDGAAMVACEAIFGIHYDKPIPTPTWPCHTTDNLQESDNAPSAVTMPFYRKWINTLSNELHL